MRPEDVEVCKVRLRQRSDPLRDVEASVREQLAAVVGELSAGTTVAVAVGSRGITDLQLVVKTVVSVLSERGADVYIVPAMGSHGGATADGQREILHSYGITKEEVGAPVRSSMEVVEIGMTEGADAIPVYVDANACAADKIVVINRVKAHTDFCSEHESGIVKMLTIGLGKQKMASQIHMRGAEGLSRLIPLSAKKVISTGKILAAVAILEDGNDKTCEVRVISAQRILDTDRELLIKSKEIMPRLPFTAVDALVVDCMGKDISGTGMDPNVIGRYGIRGVPDMTPTCTRIAVLDLSPRSHGNALGIGLADVITKRLYDKMDFKATYENVITSGFLERGFLPIVCDTDRAAVGTAMCSSCAQSAERLKLVRIKNTRELDEIYVSRSLWETGECGGAVQITDFKGLEFLGDGTIARF